MPQPKDTNTIVILGAGIVGICTALSLLERNYDVHLIDRSDPGQAASFGNAGVVSPWSIIPQATPGIWKSIPKLLFGPARPLQISPRSIAKMIPWGLQFLSNANEAKMRQTADTMSLLCSPSIEIYRELLKGTGQEHLIKDSFYVHAFRGEYGANENSLDSRIRKEKGGEIERIGSVELQKLEPALSPCYKSAILIKNQARALNPGKIGETLVSKAQAMGCRVTRDEINGLRHTGSHWEISSKIDTYTASKVVVSMGAWTPKLLNSLGIEAPMMAERGVHIQCANPGIEITHSVLDAQAKVVASSMEGGVRVAGQAEFAPADAPLPKSRRTKFTKIAKRMFPDLNTDETTIWLGARPSFPDSLPMIGAFDKHPGLFANFGHSHYGLMMAPKSGEILAQIIDGQLFNEDLSGISTHRFQNP